MTSTLRNSRCDENSYLATVLEITSYKIIKKHTESHFYSKENKETNKPARILLQNNQSDIGIDNPLDQWECSIQHHSYSMQCSHVDVFIWKQSYSERLIESLMKK